MFKPMVKFGIPKPCLSPKVIMKYLSPRAMRNCLSPKLFEIHLSLNSENKQSCTHQCGVLPWCVFLGGWCGSDVLVTGPCLLSSIL